jgi:hypothetical protein
LLKPLQECPDAGLKFRIVRGYGQEYADAPHTAALLCTSRERLNCRRATEQRDELAPFQLVGLHWSTASQGKIAGYRIGKDQSGGNGTILQPVSRWRRSPMSEVGPLD